MEQQSTGESRNVRQRAMDAARRVTDPLSSAADAVTGRAIEQRVAEYSETFTQVVIDLHEDVTAASRRIGTLETTFTQLQNRMADTDKRIEQRVSKYSEAYSKEIIGLREDVTNTSRRIVDLETIVAKIRSHLADSGLKPQREKRLYLLTIGALGTALVSLGVALWSAL